jgi:hypothetical protein
MRVSHSQGHTRRHQFQPGIITEPPAVSQSFSRSFHHALLQPTRAHWPESSPNLTWLDPTGTGSAEYGQLSPKQQRFDDETRVAVFPTRLRTTPNGATTSELEWRRSDGTIA